jgi:hypothetical protein
MRPNPQLICHYLPCNWKADLGATVPESSARAFILLDIDAMVRVYFRWRKQRKLKMQLTNCFVDLRCSARIFLCKRSHCQFRNRSLGLVLHADSRYAARVNVDGVRAQEACRASSRLWG